MYAIRSYYGVTLTRNHRHLTVGKPAVDLCVRAGRFDHDDFSGNSLTAYDQMFRSDPEGDCVAVAQRDARRRELGPVGQRHQVV